MAKSWSLLRLSDELAGVHCVLLLCILEDFHNKISLSSCSISNPCSILRPPPLLRAGQAGGSEGSEEKKGEGQRQRKGVLSALPGVYPSDSNTEKGWRRPFLQSFLVIFFVGILLFYRTDTHCSQQ